jgi:hypothetical protein
MLNFDGNWRYEAPSKLPAAAVTGLYELLLRISPGGPAQPMFEILKRHFAMAAQRQVWNSSDVNFARQDLLTEMQAAAENEPLFLEALHDGLVALASHWPGVLLPPWPVINQTLQRFGAAFIVEPPNLVPLKEGLAIASAPKALSLDAQAREAIQKSWREAEALLESGKPRQAVQVATGDCGDGIARHTARGDHCARALFQPDRRRVSRPSPGSGHDAGPGVGKDHAWLPILAVGRRGPARRGRQ